MDFCILIVLVRNCANVSDSYSSIYYQRCILHLRAYWRNVTSQQINEKTFKSLHWSPRLLRAFPLRKGIIELAIISNWNFSSIMFCTFFPLKKLEKKNRNDTYFCVSSNKFFNCKLIFMQKLLSFESRVKPVKCLKYELSSLFSSDEFTPEVIPTCFNTPLHIFYSIMYVKIGLCISAVLT